MDRKNVNLSVCVPAFNEENTLKEAAEDLILNLSQQVNELEIIIVDDGSSDSTPQLAQELSAKYHQVKFIRRVKNQGIGSCYRDALAVAQGNYFTWFPSDHENSARELTKCLPFLKDDCIVTSHHRNHDSRPGFRRLISHIYTLVLNKYFRMNLKYYNGLTIIPTHVLRLAPLVADGFAFSAESIIYAVRSGCKVVELSAYLRGRACGKSKAFKIYSLWRMCKDFFRICLRCGRNIEVKNYADREVF
ncbi:MAG: glycosyltransferase family 2 protein [Candidatus Omnitrophica bacterium]|nr:glycosyltransferase family 2 protein [Candidatus Omnitrophota bacterium]